MLVKAELGLHPCWECKAMSTPNCIHTIQPREHRPPAAYVVALPWFAAQRLVWWLGHGIDHALLWAERTHQRRQLAELDDYMLRDLGLTRADVASEIRKAFWQQ
jgi:uncharacterized protein YjiS (DUF1127 family)